MSTIGNLDSVSTEALVDEARRRIAAIFPRVQEIAGQLDSRDTARLLDALSRMADQSTGELVLNINDLAPLEVAEMLNLLSGIAQTHGVREPGD